MSASERNEFLALYEVQKVEVFDKTSLGIVLSGLRECVAGSMSSVETRIHIDRKHSCVSINCHYSVDV